MKPMHLLVALIVAVLPSCAKTTSAVEPVTFSLAEAADSIPIGFGKTVTVGNMVVSFVDVPAESRCPTRVVCVTAGDATVNLGVGPTCLLSTPRCLVPTMLLALHTNVEPRAGTYAGMEIRLLTLRPVPEEPGPIDKDQYVAWIRIRPSV